MAKILIVEDTPELLRLFRDHLGKVGYDVEAVGDGSKALEKLGERSFDLLLTDLMLPGVDGLAILDRVRKSAPNMAVIVVTAFGSVTSAVQAMRAGAADYLEKPFSLFDLEAAIERVLAAAATQTERAAATTDGEAVRVDSAAKVDARGEASLPPLLGRSEAILRVQRLIDRVAGNDLPVLLVGESGTGKELVARQIHAKSARAPSPFVVVNCAALTESLLESELFGHEKGAFTGASFLKKGKFEVSHGGTLFLDEIGDVSSQVQVKLLRFLQDREFDRVGGLKTIRVDVRIIAATNVDLARLMAAGRFREDLYYRVNVIPVVLPPLRERSDDVPILADAFARRFGRIVGRNIRIAPDAMSLLAAFSWPGNVRELENVIERLIVLIDGDEIRLSDLPAEIREGTPAVAARLPPRHEAVAAADAGASPAADGAGLTERVEAYERGLIFEALKRCNWNQTRAADELKVKRSSLQY
ncbi:MAG: sigma-54-dependent Fis family transcriptional regulator, partial [Deltaproteobacteria bacterium]|nr:sigma-54-dependent Fis family transcriptional regulator [Deltaproteobacteria bacterium]